LPECWVLDASAPVVVGGVHVANWLIGQNCIGSVDEERILSYADEIGIDPNKLLKAFRKMNKISEKEFRTKLDFLWLMANQISFLVFKNLESRQMIKSIEKSKKELQVHKDKLEKTVELRTASLRTTNQQLQSEIEERKLAQIEKEKMIVELKNALLEIKTLKGIVPICSSCKKIRDDKGYWNLLESHIEKHSEASFSHGMCPECSDKLYGDEDWYIEMKKNGEN
jgi:hypothetical protein